MTDGPILLATDLSDEAARAYKPTMQMATALGASVVLAHVIDKPILPPPGSILDARQVDPYVKERFEESERKLAELAESLADGVDIETRVVAAEITELGLVSLAEEVNARLIAMASHGRSGLRRVVLGSFAEGVLRRARTPVLVFPPPA